MFMVYGKIMIKKILFTWSGGKDSALALYQLQKTKKYEISALLTTITEGYNRISIHGVRKLLLEKQIKSLGYSFEQVVIPKKATIEKYESEMAKILKKYCRNKVLTVAFGDIFLEDLRKYREKKLAKIKMKAMFPIWKQSTKKLANEFIDSGFKAIITCVDSKILDKKFVGREFNKQLLDELPKSVDPCGENGEFHSFVYDGPIFKKKILFKKGRVVCKKNRFCFCDLIPI